MTYKLLEKSIDCVHLPTCTFMHMCTCTYSHVMYMILFMYNIYLADVCAWFEKHGKLETDEWFFFMIHVFPTIMHVQHYFRKMQICFETASSFQQNANRVLYFDFCWQTISSEPLDLSPCRRSISFPQNRPLRGSKPSSNTRPLPWC